MAATTATTTTTSAVSSTDIFASPYWEFVECASCRQNAVENGQLREDFWITSCSHVICSDCIQARQQQFGQQICPGCSQALDQIEALQAAQTNEEVALLFRSPDDSLLRLQQSIAFQLGNLQAQATYYKQLCIKQRTTLSKAKEELAELRQMKKQYESLQRENHNLRTQLGGGTQVAASSNTFAPRQNFTPKVASAALPHITRPSTANPMMQNSRLAGQSTPMARSNPLPMPSTPAVGINRQNAFTQPGSAVPDTSRKRKVDDLDLTRTQRMAAPMSEAQLRSQPGYVSANTYDEEADRGVPDDPAEVSRDTRKRLATFTNPASSNRNNVAPSGSARRPIGPLHVLHNSKRNSISESPNRASERSQSGEVGNNPLFTYQPPSTSTTNRLPAISRTSDTFANTGFVQASSLTSNQADSHTDRHFQPSNTNTNMHAAPNPTFKYGSSSSASTNNAIKSTKQQPFGAGTQTNTGAASFTLQSLHTNQSPQIPTGSRSFQPNQRSRPSTANSASGNISNARFGGASVGIAPMSVPRGNNNR